MRFLFRAEWDTEAGNAKIKDGSMPETVQSILDQVKPEAAYFIASNGKRCALLVVDMQDASELPGLAEPWFLAFNATVEAIPAMVPEDLMKASGDIESAVGKYA